MKLSGPQPQLSIPNLRRLLTGKNGLKRMAREILSSSPKSTVSYRWASLSEWSTRCAYADTVELSLYLKETFRNRGIGKLLMHAALGEGKRPVCIRLFPELPAATMSVSISIINWF